MEYIKLQFSSFLILFLAGITLGGLFDLYRIFRSTIKVKKITEALGDLFFWILCFILIVPLIFWSTWLELRFYVWLAIVAGLVIYFLIFSPIMIQVYLRFWRAITWLPRQVITAIQWFRLFFIKTISAVKTNFQKGPRGPKPSRNV